MKVLLIFTVILFSSISYAQAPLSQTISLKPLTDKGILQLPAMDKDRLLETSKNTLPSGSKNPIPRPLKIAEANAVNQSIEQIGQWQTINGQVVWRLQISAKDALHLNLGFKKLFLPESAQLFISDSKTGEILGQYSAADNKYHGELWTPLFKADELLIEINLNLSDKEKLHLNLVQVGQGFKSINPGQYNTKSGDCNIDVVCPEGDNWRNEIRAVARYTITDRTGTFLCTGTLINNTRGDLEPLFLTAAHCLVSDTTAASMVFYWNYETSVCGGSLDGALNQMQTGASLVSRWEGLSPGSSSAITNSDFALVRLDSIPVNAFNVYYAGWDNRDQTHTGSITIHHPEGDEKRISQDNDPLTITHFSGDLMDPNGRFLKVADWDSGTTEGGSSGAGLWNLNHHLIGTLSGGLASCAAPDAPDWYGRMAAHWLGNNYESNQLAAFLAPNAPDTETLAGINNCAAPTVTISVSSNTPAVDEQVSFTSMVTGGSGGYSYQWDFNNDGTVDSTVANPLHTYNSASNNKVRLFVSDSSQCPGFDSSMVLAADSTETFLGNGLQPDVFNKTASAEGSWIVDDSRASEGLFSLKSQIVNGDESSSIELRGNYEAGNISFDRRVSSEDTFDFFKFYIDEVEKFSIAGEQDWANVSFPISAGNHTFRWSFEKDAYVSGGQDAGWIDNLQFPVEGNNPPMVVTAIPDQAYADTDTVSLDVSGNFSDADGDVLQFTMTGAPNSLTINSGVISGTLVAGDANNSPYSIQVTANDGQATVSDTFILTVISNQQPIVVTTIANQDNTEGDTVSLDISASFSDPDGDQLGFTMANGPGNLSIDNSTGVISGTLTASDATASPYTVAITASDGALEVTTTFSWTVSVTLPPPPLPTRSSGGGSTGLLVTLLLFALGIGRRKIILPGYS